MIRRVIARATAYCKTCGRTVNTSWGRCTRCGARL